jgi:hypothetical protein
LQERGGFLELAGLLTALKKWREDALKVISGLGIAIGVGAMALLASGCASIEHYAVERDPVRVHWQRRADQVTRHFGVLPVHVMVVDATLDGSYTRSTATIELGRDNSDLGMRWLLAHELGHHLDRSEGVSQLEREMTANRTAVQILQVWGATTDDAVALVEAVLFTSQLRRAAVSGHDWCAELTDIHARFSDRHYDLAVVASGCPVPPEPLRSG